MIRYLDRTGTQIDKDEFFRPSLESSSDIVRAGVQVHSLFFSSFEGQYQGPVLILAHGFGDRVCVQIEELKKHAPIVTAGLSDGTILLQIPVLEGTFGLPWSGVAQYVAESYVHASLVLICGVNLLCSRYGITGATYTNDNDAIAVSVQKQMVKCPYCSIEFSISDAGAWDGTRHLLCNQRLSF